MVLAVAGGSDLLKRTQQVFFAKKPSKVSKVSGNDGYPIPIQLSCVYSS